MSSLSQKKVLDKHTKNKTWQCKKKIQNKIIGIE